MLSLQQRVQIVLLMARLDSVTAVQRELRKEGIKDVPSDNTIRSLFQKFVDTGNVSDLPRSGRPTISNETVEDTRLLFDAAPSTSLRSASHILNVSATSVHKILTVVLHYHPYKFQLTQKLEEEDFSNRMQACEELLQKVLDVPTFFSFVLTSDECTFYLNGVVNRHNCRIWGREPPDALPIKTHSSPKLNVWLGLSSSQVIGPYFFPGETIRGDDYLHMLETFLVPHLKQHRLLSRTWFQQDGASPHWSKTVRAFLDLTFPNRWIGRGGPLTWPPRSPDLNPLDFFAWGYLKDRVYHRHPKDLAELRTFIEEESQNISKDMLKRVMNDFASRLQTCIDNNGYSVEH
jgi:hypothetical protein